MAKSRTTRQDGVGKQRQHSTMRRPLANPYTKVGAARTDVPGRFLPIAGGEIYDALAYTARPFFPDRFAP